MKPTTTEMRELEQWIHEHVMRGNEFVGLKKRGLWYRPNAHGYTDRAIEAGKYTREEAAQHASHPREPEPVVVAEFPTPYYTTDPAAAFGVFLTCWKLDAAALSEWLKVNEPTPENICKKAKSMFQKV